MLLGNFIVCKHLYESNTHTTNTDNRVEEQVDPHCGCDPSVSLIVLCRCLQIKRPNQIEEHACVDLRIDIWCDNEDHRHTNPAQDPVVVHHKRDVFLQRAEVGLRVGDYLVHVSGSYRTIDDEGEDGRYHVQSGRLIPSNADVVVAEHFLQGVM